MRTETEDGLQLIRKPTVPSRTALLLNEEPIHNRLEIFAKIYSSREEIFNNFAHALI